MHGPENGYARSVKNTRMFRVIVAGGISLAGGSALGSALGCTHEPPHREGPPPAYPSQMPTSQTEPPTATATATEPTATETATVLPPREGPPPPKK